MIGGFDQVINTKGCNKMAGMIGGSDQVISTDIGLQQGGRYD